MSKLIVFKYKNKVLSSEELVKLVSLNDKVGKNSVELSIEEQFATLKDKNLSNCILSERKITKDQLINVEFTAIMRIASQKCDGVYLYPNLVESIKEHLNMRPLPIKYFITQQNDGEVKKIPIVLHDHQFTTISYVRNREMLTGKMSLYGLCGVILKLQMGLGKTLIAMILSLVAPRPSYPEIKHGENGFPTLVVASKTVMGMWKRDGFEKFFGDNVRVLYLHKSFMTLSEISKLTREQIVSYDFVVTTYDFVCSASKKSKDWKTTVVYGEPNTLMNGKIVCINTRTRVQSDNYKVVGDCIIFHTPWERVIFDESQRFASPKTFTYKAVMSLYGKYKVCLTGTPIKNYDTDIWSQFRICGYDGITKAKDWFKYGVKVMKTHNLSEAIFSVDYKDTLIVLPEKRKVTVTVSFEKSSMESIAYKFVLGVIKNVYDMMMESQASFACVIALFTRLRQMCIAPYLITEDSKREKLKGSGKKNDMLAKSHLKGLYEDNSIWNWVTDKNGTAGMQSSKMLLLIEQLRKIPKDEKTLIFSTFTSCLDLAASAIEKYLGKTYAFEHMDGDTPESERDRIQDDFSKSSRVKILLLTYKVGSEGLNLTAANNVIYMEPWWTYSVGDQACARCWRPGQTKRVNVYNIYVKNTIEEKVIEICEEKRAMADFFLKGVERTDTGGGGGLNKQALGRIIGIKPYGL